MPQNPSAIKRQKELARLEYQKEKREKKKQRQQEKDSGVVRKEEFEPGTGPAAPGTQTS
ncbi:MAG TPA: hypothetical protein VGK67_20060 [Myxococcales bacterium]|jgi:hypothetical protein